MNLFDTTGVGDIFCATFCCTMLREKDFLWALSFAGGAAQAALETKNFGLDKFKIYLGFFSFIIYILSSSVILCHN